MGGATPVPPLNLNLDLNNRSGDIDNRIGSIIFGSSAVRQGLSLWWSIPVMFALWLLFRKA